jgi:hypothetical protein
VFFVLYRTAALYRTAEEQRRIAQSRGLAATALLTRDIRLDSSPQNLRIGLSDWPL